MASHFKRGMRYAWVRLSNGDRPKYSFELSVTQAETEAALRAEITARYPGQEIVKIDYNPAFAVEVENA